VPDKVSTHGRSVQVCEGCGQFVGTLLVRRGDGARVVCEACALEAGERDHAIVLGNSADASLSIDRDWVSEWVPRLSLAEIRIYLWLALQAGSYELPTTRRLMRDCCLQRRTVQMSLEKLCHHGLVHRLRTPTNDRQYMIVRCESGCTEPHRTAVLCRVTENSGQEVESHTRTPIHIGQGGDLRTPPNPNPEFQGGDLRTPPQGGTEQVAAGGVLYSQLRNRRDSALLLRRSEQTCSDYPGGGAITEPPLPSRIPSRPCGPSTHPPIPDPSSPDGSHSSSDPEVRSSPDGSRPSSYSRSADSTARAEWTGYHHRVLREVRAKLRQLAKDTATPCTEEMLTEFLDQGARQTWLWKRCQEGAIGSPLHLWCEPARFLGWLRRKSTKRAAFRDHDVDAVRQADRETRLRIAREAGALAAQMGSRSACKSARRKK